MESCESGDENDGHVFGFMGLMGCAGMYHGPRPPAQHG